MSTRETTRVSDAVWGTLRPASPIFTTHEAAAAAGVHADVATRALGQMAIRGLLTRVTRGLWADTTHPDFSPYGVVPYLTAPPPAAAVGGVPSGVPSDAPTGGYVSVLSALNLRGMIQQIPRTIQIVTGQQRRPLRTPVGTYEFHRLTPELLGGSEPFGQLANFDVATPAKALFDTIYLSVHRGRRFTHLPELELPRTFRRSEMESWIRRIPDPRLRAAVSARWDGFRRMAHAA